MLAFNTVTASSNNIYDKAYSHKLLFVCKAEGATAAIPRLLHRHEDRLELMLIIEGNGYYHVDGVCYEVKAGDFLVFNAGILHDEVPLASENMLIISCGINNLKFSDLPLNHAVASHLSPVLSCGHRMAEIEPLFRQLCTQTTSNSEHSATVVQNLLTALLLLCRDLWHTTQPVKPKVTEGIVSEIRTLIDNNYTSNICYRDMSEQLKLSRFNLSYMFKSRTGHSPKKYQTRRRIGEAQSLLLTTDMDLESVARSVGYENINNFHRIFHNAVGISPARYRKFWLQKERLS